MYFSALATGRVTVKHVKRKIELLSSKRWSACWPVNLLVRPALMTSLSVHTASSLTPRAVCVTKVRDEKEVSLEEMRNERKPSVWINHGSQSLAKSASLLNSADPRIIRRFSSLRHPRPYNKLQSNRKSRTGLLKWPAYLWCRVFPAPPEPADWGFDYDGITEKRSTSLQERKAGTRLWLSALWRNEG